jgi:hypothetical protein
MTSVHFRKDADLNILILLLPFYFFSNPSRFIAAGLLIAYIPSLKDISTDN